MLTLLERLNELAAGTLLGLLPPGLPLFEAYSCIVANSHVVYGLVLQALQT